MQGDCQDHLGRPCLQTQLLQAVAPPLPHASSRPHSPTLSCPLLLTTFPAHQQSSRTTSQPPCSRNRAPASTPDQLRIQLPRRRVSQALLTVLSQDTHRTRGKNTGRGTQGKDSGHRREGTGHGTRTQDIGRKTQGKKHRGQDPGQRTGTQDKDTGHKSQGKDSGHRAQTTGPWPA